jgi:hypothetical protein
MTLEERGLVCFGNDWESGACFWKGASRVDRAARTPESERSRLLETALGAADWDRSLHFITFSWPCGCDLAGRPRAALMSGWRCESFLEIRPLVLRDVAFRLRSRLDESASCSADLNGCLTSSDVAIAAASLTWKGWFRWIGCAASGNVRKLE